MNHIYLAPLPENKLDRRGRVNGHIYYKLDREGEDYLDAISKRFQSDGISAVYAADLAAKPAEYLARKLNTGHWTTRKLRGFNFGKFNGRTWEEVEKIVKEISTRWDENQTVPVVGGDSWTSYERRFIHEIFKIVGTPGSVSLVLLLPHLDMGVFMAVAKHQERPWQLLAAHDARYKVVKIKVKDVANNNAQAAGAVAGDSQGEPGHSDVGVPDIDAGVAEGPGVQSDPATSSEHN